MNHNKYNDYDINGPVNLFKLELNNKIIYIYFDVLQNINNMTDCSLISNPLNKSIDIDKYLINFFKKTSEEINFFIPNINDKNIKNTNKRGTYREQILKIPFVIKKRNINYIENNYNNKYLDELYIISSEIFYLLNNFNVGNFNVNNNIKLLKENFSNILKYINKFEKKYKQQNENIKINIINELKKLKSDIERTQKILKTEDLIINVINMKKYIDLQLELYKEIRNITYNLIFIINTINNIELIKIILNNNNKTILYLEYESGINLLHILVKYYNYKITYRFYSDRSIDKESVDTLLKIIKNKEFDYESQKFMEKMLIYKNINNEIIQCINFIKISELQI